jgi:quinoprotein glucose dehydrogenase
MRFGRAALFVAFVSAAACGGKGNPGSPNPGPGDGGERITGNERLGWNQSASSDEELSRLRYAAYVDGNRAELAGVQCLPAGTSYSCSSRMPSMAPGAHTLELASFIIDGDQTIEGARSAPLRVTVTGAVAGADPASNAASTQTTADGQQLRLDVLAAGVQSVTALAFSEDGLMFVGERSGRIHVIGSETLGRDASAAPSALDGSDNRMTALDDVVTIGAGTGGLLDLALDPAFARTRLVYALYTTAGPDGAPEFRIARFREAAGRLGERAVLFDELPASAERPAASIGFGSDGKLYAAFDDGGDPSRAQRASSYSGKVLRLNADGTTPDDQPAGTPVLAADYRSPRGLDWHPGTGALWVADEAVGRVELIRITDTRPRHPRVPARRLLHLPAGTDAASIAFYTAAAMPALQGDLFAASAQGRHLLRLRLDRRDPARIVATERLFADVAGPITALATGPDGALYLGTDRAVLRIGPR